MSEAAQGYAAVNYRGEILVKTLSDTRRAAMINWLVTEALQMIFSTDTDSEIEQKFYDHASKRGLATIEPVTIAISPADRKAEA
jgi:hypothetical protein